MVDVQKPTLTCNKLCCGILTSKSYKQIVHVNIHKMKRFPEIFWKGITSELEHLLGTEYCFWKLTEKISHKIFSVMPIVVILSWWITSEQIMSQTKLKRQNKSQKTDILRIILILHTHENQFLNPKHLGLCYFDMPLT